MLFFPCHIILFTKRVTSLSLNLGSGAKGIFLGCVLRIFLVVFAAELRSIINDLYWFTRGNKHPVPGYQKLFLGFLFLCTVFRTALLAVFYTCSVKATPYN